MTFCTSLRQSLSGQLALTVLRSLLRWRIVPCSAAAYGGGGAKHSQCCAALIWLAGALQDARNYRIWWLLP